jgi:hypothetical protein
MVGVGAEAVKRGHINTARDSVAVNGTLNPHRVGTIRFAMREPCPLYT